MYAPQMHIHSNNINSQIMAICAFIYLSKWNTVTLLNAVQKKQKKNAEHTPVQRAQGTNTSVSALYMLASSSKNSSLQGNIHLKLLSI